MKKKFIFALLLAVFIFPHQLMAETHETEVFRQEGIASWYGREFEGRPTASGEIFDSSQLTAAHPTLPFGTMVVVTNQHNNRRVTVKINDRGPFVAARVIDVSRAAAEQLDMIITGTAPVLVESIDRIVVTNPVTQPVFIQPSAHVQVVQPQPVQEQPAQIAQQQIPLQTVQQTQPVQQQQPVQQIQPVQPVPQQQLVQQIQPVQPVQQQQSVQQIQPVQPVQQQPVQQVQPVQVVITPVVTAPPVLPAVETVSAPVVIQAAPPPAPVFVQPAPALISVRLTPELAIAHNKTYRLQVGSFKVARNAVETFERLRNAGLNPAYERFEESGQGEYFRVVLAGIPGADIQQIVERLGAAGFREALIREER